MNEFSEICEAADAKDTCENRIFTGVNEMNEVNESVFSIEAVEVSEFSENQAF